MREIFLLITSLFFFPAIRDHRLGDCLKNFRAAPGAERKTFLTRYSPGSPISDNNGARM